MTTLTSKLEPEATTPLGARRPLTREELHHKNHQIQRRCYTTKADGTQGLVSSAHISRIFNPDHPHTPSPGLAKKIAAALTEILGREVLMDDLYEYFQSIGKSLEWPKQQQDDND